MATNDPTLDKTLVMLDHTVEPEEQGELLVAEQLAEKLGLPFDPLDEFQVDPELFRAVPVEVMLRYQFFRDLKGVPRMVYRLGKAQ